jgi:mRNA interferase HigB
MNTISFRRILEFVKRYPDSRSSLTAWYKITRKAKWRNLAEVRQVYPHADLVGSYYGF